MHQIREDPLRTEAPRRLGLQRNSYISVQNSNAWNRDRRVRLANREKRQAAQGSEFTKDVFVCTKFTGLAVVPLMGRQRHALPFLCRLDPRREPGYDESCARGCSTSRIVVSEASVRRQRSVSKATTHVRTTTIAIGNARACTMFVAAKFTGRDS